MPMKVLGLDVKRKRIGQEPIQCRRHLLNGLRREVGRGPQRRGGSMALKLGQFGFHGAPLFCCWAGGSVALPTFWPGPGSRSETRPWSDDSHKVYYGIYRYMAVLQGLLRRDRGSRRAKRLSGGRRLALLMQHAVVLRNWLRSLGSGARSRTQRDQEPGASLGALKAP